MAEMGLVRKIDDLGRVVIPKEFRIVSFVVIQLVCKSVNSIFALPALQSIKHSSMKSLICRWSEVNVVSFTHHQVECVSMEHADPKEDD